MATKRTYKPSKVRRARRFGFRARNSSAKGKLVLKRRIRHKRHKLTV